MASRVTKRQRTLTSNSAGTDKAQVEHDKAGFQRPIEPNSSLEYKHGRAPSHSNLPSSPQIGPCSAVASEDATASSAHSSVDEGGTQAPSTANQLTRRSRETAPNAERSFRVPESTSAKSGGSVDEDIVDDYDSCEELFTKHFSGQNLADKKSKSKPFHHSETSNVTSIPNRSRSERSTAPSKRFILPPEPTDRDNIALFDNRGNGSIPWAQRFQPHNLEELAVHKKKVSDVRHWLEASFMGTDRSRLLVLRGPAGSGKTTTISLLSKTLNFDILEWKNPLVSQSPSRGSVSVSSQFDDFLGRCHDFKGLDLSEDRGVPQAGAGADPGRRPRRLVLIEEFPTLSNTWSSSLAAFRLSLHRYLAMAVPSTLKPHGRGPNYNEVPPIVIIVSEALLNFSSETLTVNRLLGPEVCNHHHTTIIDFNSIAPTIMHKALKDVLLKQSRHSKNFRFPRAAMLHNISRVGDIRSAISSLEFLCRRTEGIGESVKRTSRASKKPQDSGGLTPTEKETLNLVTHREASLGMFHAVGKIVYNKREDKNIAADAGSLAATPDCLSRHDRAKVPQVSVNELVDATGTDVQTFIYALHENYVPSCNGSTFTECLGGCIEALSDSDALCFNPDRTRKSWAGSRTGISGGNASTDVIRQQDISYQVATRGLLYSLPYPVKRQATTDGRANEAHKLSFPASLRLSYDTEEVESLVNLWLNKVLHQSTQSTSGRLGGLHISPGLGKHDGDSAQRPVVTMVSRSDMILYQLPYMARMPRNKQYLPEFKKLVELSGGNSGYGAPDDRGGIPNPRTSTMLSHEDEEGGLLLSDEDIVDD